MKTRNSLLLSAVVIALSLFVLPLAQAQTQTQDKTQTRNEAQVRTQTKTQAQGQTCEVVGPKFVDLDGDGFNDAAPDADGDGIPNGLDSDYMKHVQNGTAYQHAHQNAYENGQNLQDEITRRFQAKFMSKSQEFYRLQAANGYTFRWMNGSLGETTGDGMGACNGFAGSMSGSGTGDGSGPNGQKRVGQ